MTRLKPPSQIFTLHKTAQHSKSILQKRVCMLNAQILFTAFCSPFVLFPPTHPPNTQLKMFLPFVP